MGFSNQERINLFTKALAAGVFDANSTAVWYESNFPFQFILPGSSIWTELGSVPAAGSLAVARTNATDNPNLIQDLSQSADAVRLTLVSGTNDSTYVAYSTYDDTDSAVLGNWLLPQLVRQSSGAASNGYAIQLYEGDPNAGGTLITTSEGTTGTGVNKTVGWIFNYASGILILSDDYKANITDPYIVGFRYIGDTADTSSAESYTADETIAVAEVLRFVNSDDAGLTPGRVIKANSAELATSQFAGVATSTGTQGNTVTAAKRGKKAVKFSAAPASSSNGSPVFVSSTDGLATLTPPTTATNSVFKIGTLEGADGSTTTPLVDLLCKEEMLLG